MNNRSGTVAVIPVKQRSTRTPGKNFRLLGGVPIWQWIIRTLLTCEDVGYMVLATSPGMDPKPFLDFALFMRCPSRLRIMERPDWLCQDDAGIHEILTWVDERINAERYVQTHVCNPFVSHRMIRRALELLPTANGSSVLAVEPIQQVMWRKDDSGKAVPVNHDPSYHAPGQALSWVYIETCALSVFYGEMLQRVGNRTGPDPILMECDPIDAWDIDEEWQFGVADAIAERRGR